MFDRLTAPTARTAGRSWQRFTSGLWPLLQKTAAGTAAWVIAKHVGGHADPFFAPIAAVAALNASLGERGTNALKLVLGVVLGIVTGELTIIAMGGGYIALTLAMFIAMGIAKAIGGAAMVVGQAAASAILTVSIAGGDAGIDRLIDALIGAGIALIFSQLLFPPEPLGLLRRAEASALKSMAEGFRLTAEALEDNANDSGDDSDDDAIAIFRETRDRFAELGRMRQASTAVARHSLPWRRRAAPVIQENENAGQLDLLGSSSLALARTALDTDAEARRSLAPMLRTLAEAIQAMSTDPGDRQVRQQAADQSLEVISRFHNEESAAHGTDVAAVLRMVVVDILVFAGAELQQAMDAVKAGVEVEALDVPEPARASRTGFASSLRRRWQQHTGRVNR